MAKIIKKHSKKVSILAMIFLLMFGYFFTSQVKAGAATTLSDILSDSRNSVVANHTIQFDLAAGTDWDAGDTLTLTFESDFDLTALAAADPNDYDIDTGAEESIAAAGACLGGLGDEIEITSIVGQKITFTACPLYTAPGAGSTITIEIGTNATAGGGSGDSQITNPTSNAIYDIDVAGTIGDTGKMQVAIVDAVSVSAVVSENLSFTVTGIDGGSCPNYTGHSGNSINATATAVAFGTIGAGSFDTFIDGCQTLAVVTNAANGYNLTAQETTLLTTGVDNIADTTCNLADCSPVDVTTWDISTVNGFGYCMEDSVGNGAGTADNEWLVENCTASGFKPFGGPLAATNIMTSAAAAEDTAYIGYSLSVNPMQQSGTYTTTAIYILTPTY